MFCLFCKIRVKGDKCTEHPEIAWKFRRACAHSLEVENTGLAGYKGCQGIPIIRMADEVQDWFEAL